MSRSPRRPASARAPCDPRGVVVCAFQSRGRSCASRASAWRSAGCERLGLSGLEFCELLPLALPAVRAPAPTLAPACARRDDSRARRRRTGAPRALPRTLRARPPAAGRAGALRVGARARRPPRYRRAPRPASPPQGTPRRPRRPAAGRRVTGMGARRRGGETRVRTRSAAIGLLCPNRRPASAARTARSARSPEAAPSPRGRRRRPRRTASRSDAAARGWPGTPAS